MGSLSNGCWKANAGLDQELKHSDGITLSHLTLLGCYKAPQGERYFALRGKTTRLGFVIICQMCIQLLDIQWVPDFHAAVL